MQNDKHQKIKNRLKIIGFIVLAAGLACTITGMVDLFVTAANASGMPKLFFLTFIGVPMLGAGGWLLGFAFRREIMTYVKNESVPVINEAGKEIAPAVKDIAEAAKSETKKTVKCDCGAENPENAKFCNSCGKKLRE